MHRYTENASARNCFICIDKIENENHFIYECLLYTDLRERFLNNRPRSLVSLLQTKDSSKLRSLAKYIHYAMERRKQMVIL